jgi:Family of unknown function (DUF6522)
MAMVEFEEGTLRIDAAVIGQGLNVEPSLVQVRMREGKITVLCEHGIDEDAGLYRMTFFYENRSSHFDAQALSMTPKAGPVIIRSPQLVSIKTLRPILEGAKGIGL